MINVSIFYKNQENETDKCYIGFSINGHADYGESGQDIICAAVSALSLHTANALSELTDNDFLIEEHEDGYLKVVATDEIDSHGQLLINAFVMSIINIHDDYSNENNENEFIQIQFEEV